MLPDERPSLEERRDERDEVHDAEESEDDQAREHEARAVVEPAPEARPIEQRSHVRIVAGFARQHAGTIPNEGFVFPPIAPCQCSMKL